MMTYLHMLGNSILNLVHIMAHTLLLSVSAYLLTKALKRIGASIPPPLPHLQRGVKK